MRVITKLLVVVSALFASAMAQAGAIYDYKYTFQDGTIVNGSFTGTANGNLISGLTNISAYVNGNALIGSGSLFASCFHAGISNWQSGCGVASFDGNKNNFLFIDVNYPNPSNYSNYFYASNFYTANTYAAMVYATSGAFYVNEVYSAGRWEVVAHDQVPEPGTLALLGLGLAGLGLTRRRKVSRQT